MTKKHASVAKVTDIDNVRIGLIVAGARNRRYMTVDDLSTYIGCDHSTLTGYETGRRPIPANRIPRLAEALGLEPRILDRSAA